MTETVTVHPLFVRLTHWINAVAIIIMIGSGWHIFNNVPLIDGFHFPRWAVLGGDPELTYKLNKDTGFGNALLWHFAAMWVFFINGTAALIYGFATGRLRRNWLPIRPRDVAHDFREALRFHLAHDDPRIYNAVQKLSYVGVVLAALLVFASGLAIWKPVQFSWLTALFYDFQGARLAHFIGMSLIVLFLLVHVSLALLVPKTLVAMTKGSVRIATPDRPSMQPGE
ncbi:MULTISPECIES: cytochrome b/b6 domain-containing protein [Rhodomicrobium]|uniref:cytochrome b/b6 domain-containing protein n=1 Tax=Rhodomicrobium TaxID=1068 RepID=UPI000B4C171B|nr:MULTISPECIES: cytochrome b/b6 domain-containing protein [Rhodomicrobium]